MWLFFNFCFMFSSFWSMKYNTNSPNTKTPVIWTVYFMLFSLLKSPSALFYEVTASSSWCLSCGILSESGLRGVLFHCHMGYVTIAAITKSQRNIHTGSAKMSDNESSLTVIHSTAFATAQVDTHSLFRFSAERYAAETWIIAPQIPPHELQRQSLTITPPNHWTCCCLPLMDWQRWAAFGMWVEWQRACLTEHLIGPSAHRAV